jgi:hypothetical protein
VRPFSGSLPRPPSSAATDVAGCEGPLRGAGSTADDSDCIANAGSPAETAVDCGRAALRFVGTRSGACDRYCDTVRQLSWCRPGFPGWLDSGTDLGAERRPAPAGIGSGTSVHQHGLGLDPDEMPSLSDNAHPCVRRPRGVCVRSDALRRVDVVPGRRGPGTATVCLIKLGGHI